MDTIRSAAQVALDLIGLMSDAEHFVLQHWLLVGARSTLTGVCWEAFPEPLFERDNPEEVIEEGLVQRSELANAVLWFVFAQRLPIAPVIIEWLTWHSREPLWEMGLTDLQIGPYRIVPDDIWPDEHNYDEAHDGTIEWFKSEDGTSHRRLFFKNVPIVIWTEP